MRIAVIKSDNEALHNLIVDTLKDIDDDIEIIEIDETNLDIIADGVLASSAKDLDLLNTMMDYHDYGMVITGGKIINGLVPIINKHISNYNEKILWRDKRYYKHSLNEMYKFLKGKKL